MGDTLDMGEALGRAKNWPARSGSWLAQESHIREALESLENSARNAALEKLRGSKPPKPRS